MTRAMNRIGAHLPDGDPLAEARAAGLNVVQFFLGDPQGWKDPVLPGGAGLVPGAAPGQGAAPGPAEIRDAFAGAGIHAYVHAPYVINVASPNNRIRIPSRKLLARHLAAAAAIGAKGLIVHGGYVTAGAELADGYDSWRKAIERIDRPLPMLIENTAGGDGAMARGLDAIARLWEVVAGAADGGGEVGFCLDTCHAYASGEDLGTIVDRVMAVTGRVDLVHCNNSRDEFGSGRDRHAGLQAGTIDPSLLVGVVAAADAPVVCETPDAAADARWVRDRLGG